MDISEECIHSLEMPKSLTLPASRFESSLSSQAKASRLRRGCQATVKVGASRAMAMTRSPVAVWLTSINRSSEPEASIEPSWLKLSVRTGHSSLDNQSHAQLVSFRRFHLGSLTKAVFNKFLEASPFQHGHGQRTNLLCFSSLSLS